MLLASRVKALLTGLDASTLSLIVLVLLLGAVAHLLLRYWVRRHGHAGPTAPAAPVPEGHLLRGRLAWVLRQVLPALVLLLWIHAIYFSQSLLLNKSQDRELAADLLVILNWAYGVSAIAALFWLLSRIGRLIEAALISLSTRTTAAWDDVAMPLAGLAIRLALPLLAVSIGAPALALSPRLTEGLQTLTTLLLIAVIAYILVRIVNALASLVLTRRLGVDDTLHTRSVYTQVLVLRKACVSIIAVLAVAAMLMVFDSVRQLGASILASAGVAGIVVGVAAQRSIAALVAGFQIALTQPIRIDDVVVVQGEWGQIEDITLTYVVVRVWDLRRLVVPITFFIEQPFQNWTHTASPIVGSVFLYVDYTMPVDAIRQELTRILRASPLWNGQVNTLQVTNAKEQTLELRVTASAATAALVWDLQCEIRERLIAFVQTRYPGSLPRLRASFDPMRGQDAGSLA